MVFWVFLDGRLTCERMVPLTSPFLWWITGDLKELVPFTPLSSESHSQKFQVGIRSETGWVAETDTELMVEFYLFVLICYSEYKLISSGQNLDFCQNLEVIPALALVYCLQKIDAIRNGVTQSWVISTWLKMRWRGACVCSGSAASDASFPRES